MKTKELIELLQKEDPEGNCHVRVCGEMPFFCEKKPGYWDGPYTYIEDDTMVFSTKGNKVDIYTLEPDDWAERHLDDWRDKIRFEYGYSDDDRKEKIIKSMEEVEKEWKFLEQQSMEQFTFSVLQKIKDGWKIYHDKDQPVQYHRMYWKKGVKTDRLMQGECAVLLESGLFHLKDGEWIFDVKKGKTYK